MIESKDWANSLLACFPPHISAFLSWLYSPLNSFHVVGKNDCSSSWLMGPNNLRPQRQRAPLAINLWERPLFDFVWIPCSPLTLSPGEGHFGNHRGLLIAKRIRAPCLTA